MADIQPGHYWSHSLGQALHTCHRRVYYWVYGSWGGWRRSNGEIPYLLYLAKKSNTLPTYAGSFMHNAAQGITQRVRAGMKLPSNQLMIDTVDERIRSAVAYSEEGSWRDLVRPKRATLILYQHLAGEDLHPPEIDKAVDQAQSAMRAFLEVYLPYIRTWPRRDIELIDSLDAVPHNGFSIFAVPDLVLYRRNPDQTLTEIVLIDWKTGAFPNGDQLKVYAWYLVKRTLRNNLTELDPTLITGRSVTLRNLENELVVPMDQTALDEAVVRIDRDIEQLAALHEKGLARDELAFPKTTHTGDCNYCCFRFHCDLRP